MAATPDEWQEYRPGLIWIREYPIRFFGMVIRARTTVVRLSDGTLFIHSPCRMDAETAAYIRNLGHVACIVAPGSYHFSYVDSAQKAFAEAETWICPGVELKKPDIAFDWMLADRPDPRWERDMDQVLVRGNRIITEVAFFHRKSRTLILVDLIENVTDSTPQVGWQLRFWWKVVFRMWKHPKPAPEYQVGWKDKRAAAASLRRILAWDFERIIIAHGDLIEENAKAVALDAWRRPLAAAGPAAKPDENESIR
jgi:hypothetical protein